MVETCLAGLGSVGGRGKIIRVGVCEVWVIWSQEKLGKPPKPFLTGRISIHFPARVFLYFLKEIWFLAQKRRIGDELEVSKTRRMILVVSWLFSWPNNSNFTQTDSYDFSASPQTPQTVQTCFKNMFLGFLAWRVGKGHASCVFWYRRDSNV